MRRPIDIYRLSPRVSGGPWYSSFGMIGFGFPWQKRDGYMFFPLASRRTQCRWEGGILSYITACSITTRSKTRNQEMGRLAQEEVKWAFQLKLQAEDQGSSSYRGTGLTLETRPLIYCFWRPSMSKNGNLGGVGGLCVRGACSVFLSHPCLWGRGAP